MATDKEEKSRIINPVVSRMTVEEILLVALSIPMDHPNDPNTIWGAPVMFWGAPGIGKSERVEAASRHMGLPPRTVYLPTKQPEDLSGIPVPDGHGGVVTYCSILGVRELMKMQRGVLFLDELPSTRQGVQAAALSVVKERVIADMPFPRGIRIVGAGNPPKDAVVGGELGAAMANRFLHFEIGAPSTSEWTSWVIGRNNPKPIQTVDYDDKVRQKWDASYARALQSITGYLHTIQSMHEMPKQGHPSRGRAWQAPRTVLMAMQSLATCIALDKEDLAVNFIEAAVGSGFAGEWAAWSEAADLPDPVEVLEKGWKIDRQRLDICIATYSAVGSYIVGITDPDEQKRLAVRAWGLINQAIDVGVMDIAGPLARALSKSKLGVTSPDEKVVKAARNAMAFLGKSGMAAYLAE